MAARILLHQCVRHLFKKGITLSLVSPSKLNLVFLTRTNCLPVISISRHFAATSDESSQSEDALEGEVGKQIDPSKDRRNPIPVEVSMSYLKSKSYETTYGSGAVWVKYRRNFKGAWAPETRKTCIRAGIIATGNPCPICRDEYLVLDYRNIDLLKQFISPHNGAILPTMKTGLCQKKQKELLVAITKAKDYGLISFDVPLRDYDYSDYNNVKSN